MPYDYPATLAILVGVNGITFGNGVFVATTLYKSLFTPSLYPAIYSSSNLVDWVPSHTQTNSIDVYSQIGFSCLTFGGNQFITGLDSGYGIFMSSDGYSWITNNDFGFVSALIYGQGTFVAGQSQHIYQSGIIATNSNSPAPTALGISTYPGVTITGTAGAVYQIQSSPNLVAWQTLTNFMLPYSPYVWVDTSSPTAGQKFYRSVQLP